MIFFLGCVVRFYPCLQQDVVRARATSAIRTGVEVFRKENLFEIWRSVSSPGATALGHERSQISKGSSRFLLAGFTIR